MNEEDHKPSMEEIRFIGNDEESTFLIHKNNTTVFSSQESHNKGSSKLTLKNFVDFNWDQCYYKGQLIALHIGENYIAYGFTKPGTSEGMVRIVNRETKERTLIKGFSSLIEDLRFAHLYEIIMLACIEQSGSVIVSIVKEDSYHKLRVFPVFQINGDPSYCFINKYLISWCQHIPEQVKFLKALEFESGYKGKILAVVRGSEVEIWHIGIASNFTAGPVHANFDLNTTISTNVLNNLKNALIKISLKESEIVNVTFSPDGSTISLALHNGSIYFYHISFEDLLESTKCVFIWHPEEIFLSLKSMAFLDNRKKVDGDVELWKYMVTLSSHNEIILWSCETWECLQKLKFIRRDIGINSMKLAVDETGKYIFLSDIDNNLLYVMEVADDTKCSKHNIKIVSITEILLQSPMLNMIIVNAKIDHNEVNFTENIGSFSNSLNKYSTIINLFAIQPKSIQEGQLIVPSPELSIMEQIIENDKVKAKSIFPSPPTLDVFLNTVNLTNDKNTEFQEKTNHLIELSSMDVHKIVKEKLKLKGVNMNKNNFSNEVLIQNIKDASNSMKQNQPSNNFIYSQDLLDLSEIRECSPSNNEVQTILEQQPEQELQYDYVDTEVQTDNFELVTNDYSTEIEKEMSNHLTDDSILNGPPSVSSIREPIDKIEQENNGIELQIDDMYSCLQDINNQLKFICKKQKKIDSHLTSCLSMNTADICQTLEPMLINITKNVSDLAQRKQQVMLDHQQKKIADIVRNSTKVDDDLFTRSLVASLSPTLDAILKDLFMSTVIPKFEYACCTMFKQIDASFTERSLEYQNELKSLLNDEGNINFKLDYAFDKFKIDLSNIIKHTEKNILCAQNDMQKQFSTMLKEQSLSHVESFVKDTENIANQYLILSDIIERGEHIIAFEKALSASNLDLVLFVCEKISPEDFFQTPNALKTPIVLSLIQQLGHDLINNTELKYKYLDVAIGSLDYTNDYHKDNMNLVLVKIDVNVEKFIQKYPFHPYTRKFKMLQLAIKSIINLNLNYANINN